MLGGPQPVVRPEQSLQPVPEPAAGRPAAEAAAGHGGLEGPQLVQRDLSSSVEDSAMDPAQAMGSDVNNGWKLELDLSDTFSFLALGVPDPGSPATPT
ncbi:unnamed protein product [Caretta caretta]